MTPPPAAARVTHLYPTQRFLDAPPIGWVSKAKAIIPLDLILDESWVSIDSTKKASFAKEYA